jgi:hypothetical protein
MSGSPAGTPAGRSLGTGHDSLDTGHDCLGQCLTQDEIVVINVPRRGKQRDLSLSLSLSLFLPLPPPLPPSLPLSLPLSRSQRYLLLGAVVSRVILLRFRIQRLGFTLLRFKV